MLSIHIYINMAFPKSPLIHVSLLFFALQCHSSLAFLSSTTGPDLFRAATPRQHLSITIHAAAATDAESSSFGLYQVQEQLIIDRGALEEELMANNYTPLQANKPKKIRGGSGGFASKNTATPSSAAALREQGKAHAKILEKEGVVRIDHVLSHDTVDELREFVFSLKETAEQQVESKQVKSLSRFADVLLRTNRCDLLIPLGPDIVTKALYEAFVSSPVRYTIEALLTKKAVLQELSCLMSYPGSQRQVMHPDTPYGAMGGLSKDEPVLYTCFIALQDVKEDMGPTVWLPQTHTQEAHDRFKDEQVPVNGEESPKDELLRTTPAKLGMLPKGACGIFDSRLLHCGGANRSEDGTTRAIFYCSFKNPKIGYPGNPPSIRPELVSKLTLEELCKDLQNYPKGKPCPRLQELAATLK